MLVNAEPYADILATARKLVTEDTTVTRYGEPAPPEGWAVGGACNGIKFSLGELTPEEMARHVARWIQAQPSNVTYFGSWYSLDEGILYFDGVTIVGSIEEAMDLLRVRGEKAAYNLAEGTLLFARAMAA